MTMFSPVNFASLADAESFAVFDAVSDTAIPHALTGEPPEDIVGWFDGIPVYALYAHGEPEDGEGDCSLLCYGDIPRLMRCLKADGKIAAHGWATAYGLPCASGFHPAVYGGGYDVHRVIPADRVITLSPESLYCQQWLAYQLPARKIVPDEGAV